MDITTQAPVADNEPGLISDLESFLAVIAALCIGCIILTILIGSLVQLCFICLRRKLKKIQRKRRNLRSKLRVCMVDILLFYPQIAMKSITILSLTILILNLKKILI